MTASVKGQTALPFTTSRAHDARDMPANPRPLRLGLALDHREWLSFLADEWWPLGKEPAVRLGVRSARGDVAGDDRIGVVAWFDANLLPDVEVMSWRRGRWLPVGLHELGDSDEEIEWPGPLPLFAVASFAVGSESDAQRLIAMAKGFANVAPPKQPVNVERLDRERSVTTPPSDLLAMSPPRDWNAIRGAAAMAVWSVPAVAPWLEALCASFDVRADPAPAALLGASWWFEPPWRTGAEPGAANDHHVALWRAAIEELREVRVRESWRPTTVFDSIRRRAESDEAITPGLLERWGAETRAILADERTVTLERAATDPVGLALQLVLLRPTPDRFATWAQELRALPPVVWWTGATLSGLLRGYRDLDDRFRGPVEGRRRLALRTWLLSRSAPAGRLRWPGVSDEPPTWHRESGRIQLRWDGLVVAEKLENGRGRWFTADLKVPAVREAAIAVARAMRPSCVRQRLQLRDARLPFAGSGHLRIDDAARTLAVQGELVFDLPAGSRVISDLDEDAFHRWLVHDGITEKLPDPPGQVPKRAGENLHGISDPEIPGLSVINEFITPAEETALLSTINSGPWRADLSRRVQHHGWAYDYKARSVHPSARIGPLPSWAAALGKRMLELGLVPEEPDQVIVNEYVSKQGISKHIDCIPCFRGPIVMITLSEPWEMFFWPPGGRPKLVRTFARRSAAVLTGEARASWSHEIPRRLKEPWGERGRRVSLTFRRVNAPTDAKEQPPVKRKPRPSRRPG